jgi:hypothetical protein
MDHSRNYGKSSFDQTHVAVINYSYDLPSISQNAVADAVLGTWFAFESNGTHVEARLSWISPLRVTYLFAPRSLSEVMVFTPEELAWAMSTGKATLLLEPVPLFDRAVSVTLEHLAERKAKRDAGAPEATADRPVPEPV